MTTYIPHINEIDPSRTTTLRSQWVSDFARRFKLLIDDIKEALVDYDVLGLVERDRIQVMKKRLNITARQFDFPTNNEKIQAFADWVKTQTDLYFLTGGKLGFSTTGQVNVGGDTAQDSWMDLYIDSAYQQGIRRGRQELKKQGIDVEATGIIGTSGDGAIRAAFNTPLHADRVGTIYTRAFSRLKGITASIDSLVSDVLAIGIAEGKGPREIASAMNRALTGKGESFGITDSLGRFIPPKRRAEMLARTEVIRAHHAANMAEYRAAGILGIKVDVEYVARTDACPECSPLDGNIYSLDEAENLIPKHVQCRCVAVPHIGD